MAAKKATKKRAPAKARIKKADQVVSTRPFDTREVPIEQKKARKQAQPKEKAPREELCVFAFRLARSERDEIHAAAGSAKASQFVRSVALAAARRDLKAVEGIITDIKSAK